MKWRPNSLLLITLFLKDPGGRLRIVQGTIMGKLKHKKIPLKTTGLHFSDMWDIFQGVAVLTSRKLHNRSRKRSQLGCLVPCLLAWPLSLSTCHFQHSLRVARTRHLPVLHQPGFSFLSDYGPIQVQKQTGGRRRSTGERRKTQRSLNWHQSWGCICFWWGKGGISFFFFFFLTLGWGSIPNRNLCLVGSDIWKPLRAFCIGTVGFPTLLLCRG